MNMAEIVKWTFIVILMAPLPVLVVSSAFIFIKEKMNEYVSHQKTHDRLHE
jgi:hypothetical protein